MRSNLPRPLVGVAVTTTLIGAVLRLQLHPLPTHHHAAAAHRTSLLHHKPPVRRSPAPSPHPSPPAVVPQASQPVVRRQPVPTTHAPAPAPKPSPKPTAVSTQTRTFVGDPDDNRYGTVQVEIKVQGTRIVDVIALQMPNDSQNSQDISDYAGPQLRDEALQAQSANIDTVSGATYTSDSYRTSLQSALDKAGL